MCMIMQFSSIVLSPNPANYFDVWAFPLAVLALCNMEEAFMKVRWTDSQQHLDLVLVRRRDDSDETRRGDDAATMRQHPRVGCRVG